MLQFKSLTKYYWISLLSCYTISAQADNLIDIIQTGLNNNLSLQASEKGLLENKNNINVSFSKFLPSLNGSADTTWNGNETILHGAPNTESSYNSHSYSLALSQTIFNMSDIYKYGTAKLDFTIEQISHANKVQNTIFEIASQYFEYLKNHAQIKATIAELKSSKTREHQMKRNVELGNTAASEIYEVTAQREEIASRLRSLRKDRQVTLNKLKRQIQQSAVPTQDIQQEIPLIIIEPANEKQIIQQSLKLNNDVLVAQKTLEKSYRSLKESRTSFMPTVSLSASYRHDDANNFDNTDPTATGKSISKSISLNMSIPIFSGGSDYYSYQKSSTAIERNQLLYQDSLSTAEDTAQTTILTLNDYIYSIESYENIIRANYTSYQGIQRAYQLGTRTITDLLAAESKLFSALRDYQSARYDYMIESLNLEKVKGLLSIDTIKKITPLMVKISESSSSELVPKHLLIKHQRQKGGIHAN